MCFNGRNEMNGIHNETEMNVAHCMMCPKYNKKTSKEREIKMVNKFVSSTVPTI